MYFANWDEFLQASKELYRANPAATRCLTKYRHCDGKLVLKVTDDRAVPPPPSQP
jgi:signal recognition particle subunit SRP9